jgi:hypothetical protein
MTFESGGSGEPVLEFGAGLNAQGKIDEDTRLFENLKVRHPIGGDSSNFSLKSPSLGEDASYIVRAQGTSENDFGATVRRDAGNLELNLGIDRLNTGDYWIGTGGAYRIDDVRALFGVDLNSNSGDLIGYGHAGLMWDATSTDQFGVAVGAGTEDGFDAVRGYWLHHSDDWGTRSWGEAVRNGEDLDWGLESILVENPSPVMLGSTAARWIVDGRNGNLFDQSNVDNYHDLSPVNLAESSEGGMIGYAFIDGSKGELHLVTLQGGYTTKTSIGKIGLSGKYTWNHEGDDKMGASLFYSASPTDNQNLRLSAKPYVNGSGDIGIEAKVGYTISW